MINALAWAGILLGIYVVWETWIQPWWWRRRIIGYHVDLNTGERWPIRGRDIKNPDNSL